MSNMTRAERLKKYGLNRDGSVNEDLQRQNANIFERIGDTYLDVNGNILKSVVRGVEGLVEGVVGVAGAVGGLFGADTQWAEDVIAQTWTEDLFSGLPDATRNSFINDLSEDGQETVRGIIDGVGQAATTVGLAFVNPALAMGYMGTSAAGRSIEEALHDDANFTDAFTYGTTQGLLETALEYVTGGASRLAKIGAKQAFKSTGKLIAGEALQEATQEGIQGTINPITKQIYKGPEALDEYNQEGFWQDVGKQALIGGVSGGMGAGMGVGIQTAATGGRKQFKVANASAQVQEALQDTTSRVAQGKMTDEQLSKAVEDINVMNDRLEGFVSKLSFAEQQKIFQPQGEKQAKYRIPQGFEWTDAGLVRNASKTTESFNDAIKQGRASVSLLGRGKEVSRLLERVGTKVYEGELASAENANYNKIRRLHQALSSKGLVRTNLVLAETMPNTEAFISDDIMVVGKDQLASEDAGIRKILHEVTHFAEGTREYKKFANFVLSQDSIKDVNARILRTAGYGITQSNIDSALKKLKKGEELTKTEKTYVTEAVAFSAEMLLSDEATIERLCKTDRSLAQKILRKIKEFIKVINSRFNGDTQMLKELRTAEKLYVKALAKSGTEYLVKQQKAVQTSGKGVDIKESRGQFSLKDSAGNTLTQEQAEFFKDSKVRDENGNLLVVYHQTDADFTVFDTKREGAGRRDQEVPHGIFLKPTDADIGMKGKKQMPLYANIKNPLVFLSRSQANRYWKTNVPGYAELVKQLADNDTKYGKEFDDAFYGKRMSRQAYRELPSDEKARLVEEYEKESERILEEWETENTKLETKAKKLIDEYLLESDYDGIHLQQDVGSFGRKVETYIALESNQVKNIDNKNPTSNEDIRFSFKENELDKFLEELSFEELMALVGEDVETVQSLPTKRERRDAYIRKLYEQGNLNKVVTDIVKSKPQMAEYFAKTQMNNKHNPLIKKDEFVVMFHGSPRDFNEFDTKKVGRHGTAMGSGIYFTDNLSYAEGYHEAGGRIFATLLKIEKPLSRNKITFTKQQLGEFIKTVVDPEGDDYLSNYGDVSRLGYDKLLQNTVDKLFAQNKNDADIIEDIYVTSRMEFDEFHNVLTETMGYDGLIAWNKAEGTQAIVFRSNQAKDIFNFKPTESSDIRYSLTDKKIEKGMSDEERYAILKDKVIKDVPVAKELTQEQLDNIGDITSWEDINKYFGSKKKNIIKKIASEFGAFDKEYFNEDIELEFDFSKTSFNESYGKQKKNFETFAKMFSVFDAVVDKAVGIEIHNRNDEGYKVDRTLHNVYVLASAFLEENNIVPVKLEVKEFLDKKNTLYVAIALESIKKDGVSRQEVAKGVAQQYRRPSFNISIRDLLKNINPQDKSFYKYIPKQFFEEEDKTQFSLKEKYGYKDKYKNTLTEGQLRKIQANVTRDKVYARKEAESIVNTILEDKLNFGDKVGSISNKTKEEAIDIFWKGLNGAGEGRWDLAHDIADLVINSAVVESIYEDDELDVHLQTISTLKPYLHSINLDNFKEEIKHRGDNSIYARWGKLKGTQGLGVDQIAQLLKEQGFAIEATADADILFEIEDTYRQAVTKIRKKADEELEKAIPADELESLREEIAHDIMISIGTKGSKSLLAKVNEKVDDEMRRSVWSSRLLFKLEKTKKLKFGEYHNATQYDSKMFDGIIGSLTKVQYGGALRKENVRPDIAQLHKWYTDAKEIFGERYDDYIENALREVSGGKGMLTADELVRLCHVADYFNKFIGNFNKVFRDGKYVDALPIAEKHIALMEKNKSVKVGWQEKGKIITKYMELMGDPMTVARRMDKYEAGFYTESMESWRTAAMNAQIDEMEMRAEIDSFLEKNKKYLEEADKKTVKYLGADIPLKEAMSLYMTWERKHARAGLALSGIRLGEGENKIELKGLAENVEDVDDAILEQYANEARADLEKQFSDADKEYIAIVRKLFNETCREKKRKTDNDLRGYSNVAKDDVYFPIKRDAIAEGVDRPIRSEIDRVSNASFNKNTVKGAKQRLMIEPIDSVVDRHIRGVALYANLSPAIQSYDILYNIDISGNKNAPVNIKKMSEDIWPTGNKYFKNMVSDIQGISRIQSDGTAFDINKIMGAARGAYARYQIGGNPKVILTQTSSFFAAVNILDIKSVVGGLGTKVSDEDVDKYCPLAKLRNYDNSAAMAQAVFDRNSMAKSKYKIVNALRKFSDWLMKFVGKMDRFVIKKLYGACQIEVEKKYNLKIGTEENMQKAGELLTRVIFETQQNSLATERSVAMRSGSEFLKAATMFSADAMKGFGRFFDAIGEYSTLKARRKLATDQADIEKIDARLNKVGKQVVKSTSALISSAVFMALIAQMFRWLYNKDEEDEDIMANMTVDAFGNMIGGLPLLRDLYSRIAQGYEIQGYSYSAINAIFDSVYAVPDAAITLVSGGDPRDMAKALKELINAAGMVTGVPTRNIYNVGYGLTKRISPTTAYKIDDFFYSQGYRADLAKALENEDEAMIATIAGLMLNENIGGITDSSARKTIDDLVKKGFDVLPKSVSTQITYNDETVELSAGQQKRFKEVYNVANESLASLVKLSQYSKATDEVKAKAIRFIFDTYHNLAKQDVLGVELETKNVLFAEAIDIEKLAIIVATVNQMTADTKNGKVVSGSKKIKVQQYVNSLSLTAAQKYMIMGYLGYKNANGEAQVKAYINSLKLTASEKEKLLSYSGY